MGLDPHAQFLKEREIRISGYESSSLAQAARTFMVESTLPKYSYNFSWLSRPIIQYPQDIVATQELIWQIRPDLIIETGIAHGGSLILSASMLALLDYGDAVTAKTAFDPRASLRRVFGIDIDIRPHNRTAIEAHPLAHMIELIEGSSVSPHIVSTVRQRAMRYRRILVLLDSNHTHSHVLAELEAYAPLVSPNSYCVVFDTVIENLPDGLYPDRPWRQGNNPMTAVEHFLSCLARRTILASDGERLALEVDSRIDSKLLITVAPRGYLRRVHASP